MGYFFSVAIIFMATFSVCFLTKKQFGIVLPVVNFSIVIFLFLFGLFDLLMVGLYAWLLAVLTLFIISLVKIIKEKNKTFVKEFFSPAVLLVLGVCILSFFVFFQKVITKWDEYSHWGLIVKNIFYHHDFGGGETATTIFKGYPVGTSLFLFFFQALNFKFSDGILFLGLNFLNLSLLLPATIFFKETGKKVIAFFFMTVCCLLVYVKTLSTIYNDIFLAICFGYVLVMYFCFKKERFGLFHFICIGSACFVLCLAKSTGVALCGFACVIIFVDMIVTNGFKQTFKNKSTYHFISILAFSILISKLGWSMHLKSLNLDSAWETSSLTLSSLKDYVFSPTTFQKQVTNNFFSNLIVLTHKEGGYNSVPFLAYVLIFYLLTWNLKNHISKKERLSLFLSSTICFTVWALSLLVLYVFTFDPSEAIILASLIRYLATFSTAILFLLTALNLKHHDIKNIFRNKIVCSVSACTLLLVMSFFSVFNSTKAKAFRKDYGFLSAQVQNMNKNDKIFIINCQDDNDKSYIIKQDWKDTKTLISHTTGKEYLVIKYIATPIQTSGMIVGGSPGIGDLWFDDVTPEETEMLINRRNYNYVYLHNITDEFKATYCGMFEETPTKQTMYKVSTLDGKMIFVKV